MAAIGQQQQDVVRLSAPLSRELRLSPRCLLSPTTSGTSSGLSSPASRRFSSSSSNNHSRQSSTDHNMSALSSSFEFTRGPPPPPPPPRHGRQGSVHSSASAEISQYMSVHSRQSSLDSSRQAGVHQHLPQLHHSRLSPLDQHNGYSLRQKLGAQLPPSGQSSRSCLNSTPLGSRLPPHFTVLGSKVSPTSLDMGYHTMVTGHGDDEESPTQSRSTSTTYAVVAGCRPKEKSTSKVSLDTQNLIASYKGSSNNSLLSPNRKGRFPVFDNLPDDVIVRIFSKLPAESLCACARVCRRFYFLAWEPNLWRSITFSGSDNLEADFAIESVLKLLARDTGGGSDVCTIVEKILFNNCVKLSDVGLSVVSRRCPELRTLELRNCREVTNAGVQAIATRCASLSSLDLSGKTLFKFLQTQNTTCCITA